MEEPRAVGPITTEEIVTVTLRGHFDLSQLARRLTEAEKSIGQLTNGKSRKALLLVDCELMTGFDDECRTAFSEWNGMMKDEIAAVAVVVLKPTWRMVVSTMTLVSRDRTILLNDSADWEML